MFNALTLSLLITSLIGLYAFGAFHKVSSQKALTPSVFETRDASSANSQMKENPFLLIFDTVLWAKLRLIYYVNNWVYTTNHKRIAVNYFWFVIFSGICGMVLATIIRLEMAYPGVGILAGDSLQYLSVVTAHAVIMVFFMIMPLLFGAWGNFLLPTQLGVHDVAFPRLNSAAFWFLPAGLLMLVQLVCLDRRYQRMNCYNIREIQTILKSKYAPASADSADVHFDLSNTALGLRYNIGGIDFLDPAIFTYYRNALSAHPRYRAFHDFINKPIVEFDSVKLLMSKSSLLYTVLRSLYREESVDFQYLLSTEYTTTTGGLTGAIQSNVLPTSPANVSTSMYNVQFFSLSDLTLVLYSVHPGTLLSQLTNTITAYTIVDFSAVFSALKSILLGWAEFALQLPRTIMSLPFNIEGITSRVLSSLLYSTTSFTSILSSLATDFFTNSYLTSQTIGSGVVSNVNESSVRDSGYSSEATTSFSVNELTSSALQESLQDSRFSRSMNSVFKYDFKVGNYLPDDAKKLNPHLFATMKDITTGIKKSSWFTSEDFSKMLQGNISTHSLYFGDSPLTGANASKLAARSADLDATFSANAPHSVGASPTSGFYNFFMVMSSSNNVLNSRWVAVNAMDQKFYRMFATSSLQQRIFANWRQLKFTREAWRCKLLAARHQNTLYKRYLSEDSVVWAVERNAKDVLPGWAMITPFSARSRFTAIGKVDIGLMGVFLVLNSSIVSSANFLITYRYLSTLNNRKMRDARSFFTEGVMVASWMMIAANPMLAIGILMLLSDRHWQTSFFDYSGGGDTVLFQHMFWFFGHPEVYVIMIPGFGFNNTILSFYLRKRVSARASLLYSMYTIAFLGFFVWGHHMYMVGLAHTTRMLFSTLTVMISVPAATKLMHWCVTLVNSTFAIELPMVFQLLFIFFFVSGGISGMAVAHTGMDILFHDSFYVIGHFHIMLAGAAMFAAFGAFYFYFPAVFGVKYSRIYGYLHCLYYLIGQLMTVVPMFWLGYAAMPRRVLDYPAALGGWHAVVSAGHMLSVAGMMAFFIMIFDSIRQGRAATRNSFGVARFNTRLNFYIYEGARSWFIQRKGWFISRFNRHDSVRMNGLNYVNNEYLETTLYSYVIVKK